MRKMARLLPTLLSVLLVSAPLSTSACDLSCWLHQTGSGCHSVSSATEDNQRPSASSEMDMSSEAVMSSHGTQCNEGPARHANAGTRHHSMSAQMNMVRGSFQAIQKSEVSSNAVFDDSNKLSPCSHETCSQASASASPPSASRAQPAYLHFVAIHISSPENFLTTFHRMAPGTSHHIPFALDPLTTLRI
jgi:hypothetical protein